MCANGYYMDFYKTCQVCPHGMYCVQNLQTLCSIGSYSEPGQSVCTQCEAGWYQDTSGASVCKTCPGGSTIIKTTTASDLQTLGIQNRAIVDETSDMIYVQAAQNYLVNAQGGNITTWSFYASNAGCVVTPVILAAAGHVLRMVLHRSYVHPVRPRAAQHPNLRLVVAVCPGLHDAVHLARSKLPGHRHVLVRQRRVFQDPARGGNDGHRREQHLQLFLPGWHMADPERSVPGHLPGW